MKFVFVPCVLALVAQSAFAAGGGYPTVASAGDRTVAEQDTTRIPSSSKDKEQLKKELSRVAAPEAAGLRQWEREKSARTAVLSSAVLPGLGQVYNGRRWKVVIFVGLETWFLSNIFYEKKRAEESLVVRDSQPEGSIEWKEANLFYEFHRENARTFVWWFGGTWLIGMLDAFIDAHLYDVRAIDPAVIRGTNKTNYIGFEVKW